tara:strand:+ start:202 stop:528 length:327 start_codon:yes stop_codon:yes gene_type:complete
MLIAINAKDEASAFRALKSELQEEMPYFSFKFDNLRSILNNLKEKHHEIADDFCTGKGLGFYELNSIKHQDRDLYLNKINNLSQTKPNTSKGYLYRKQLFEDYLDKTI